MRKLLGAIFLIMALSITTFAAPASAAPPTAPSGLAAQVVGGTVTLTWRAATDPGGWIRTYEIERDGVWVGWVWGSTTRWVDRTVDLSRSHTYRIFAVDNAREWGPRSNTATTAAGGGGGGVATMIATGDIGQCGGQQAAVAELLRGRNVTFAALGDLAYPDGRTVDFQNCYDPWFGAYKARTRPTVGNHEYITRGASPYFDYFGDRAGARDRGYYSYDVGAWHVVVLNSECWEVGGCGVNDRQYQWLRQNLTAHTGRCLMAYWHRPPFTTEAGSVGAGYMRPYFDLLQSEGADVLLAGHHHVYERWARTDSAGRRNAAGIRTFTVGTGGATLRDFGPTRSALEKRGAAYGALELTLTSSGYSWQFLRTGGGALTDSGSDTC